MSVARYLALFAAAALTGCGSGSGGSGPPVVPGASPPPTAIPLPTPAGTTDATTQTVAAAIGGTVALASGSSVTVAPSVLAHDTVLQLALVSPANITPRDPDLTTLAPALELTFFAPPSGSTHGRAPRAVSAALTFKFKLPDEVAAQFDGFTIPTLRMIFADGTSTDISEAPQYDRTSKIATFVVNAVAATATKIELYLLHVTFKCATQGAVTPGPRYFDPVSRTWSRTPPVGSYSLHPLLLLHGILSCVENAFPPPVVTQLQQDGGYDIVVGYDYDWTRLPLDVAPEIASAVPAQNVAVPVDIAAHSYGGVVAMAVAPRLGHPIQNLVLYGAPMDGAVVSDPNWFYTIAVNVTQIGGAGLSSLFPLSPAWYATFTPGNAGLAQIEAAMMSSPNAPARVIKIAGSKPPNFVTTRFLALVNGGTVPSNYDGIVPIASATYGGVSGVAPRYPNDTIAPATFSFIEPLNHTDLPSSTDVERNDVARSLAVSVSDAGGGDRSFPNPAHVFLKGIGSHVQVTWISNQPGEVDLEPNSQNEYYIVRPPGSRVVPSFADASSATGMKISVLKSPSSAPSKTPTDTLKFDFTLDVGHTFLDAWEFQMWTLPDCSSCVGGSGVTIDQVLYGIRRAPSDAQGLRSVAGAR